ncbi:hypothetical protein CLHUN_17650 [Ruminiclostridium hungatei]|uniref:tRNA nuclease CdiA C-terminal domain-containing protein n=2 Tax=Ruminiclostridium hungatei TaxID=48256 RepID=A0A1V4SLV3_RUMHU|nr:hypothetical protein CLHUN_17650 [Ruminiclostridium hungatei]
MYDAKTARFLQEDTYLGSAGDPLSLNLYTYCHNEPVMYVDPTGHADAKITELAKAAGGEAKWNSQNSSVTVTIGGVSRTFGYNEIKLVNGSAIIENETFDRKFNATDKGVEINTTVNTKTGKIDGTTEYRNTSAVSKSVTNTYKPTNTPASGNNTSGSNTGSANNTSSGMNNHTEKSWPTTSGIYKTENLPKPLLHDPIDDYYEPVYTFYMTQEDIDGFVVVTSMLQTEIKMASGAIKYLGSLFKGIPKTGKLVGSTSGLELHEVTMIDDLVAKGNTVEVVPRSNVQGVKTYDLKVNGVATELKTLANPNTGTGAKRIYEGFQQGADTVIIDGRQAGLTSQQAQEVLSRAAGKYTNKQIPGNVQIWTNDGIITYP